MRKWLDCHRTNPYYGHHHMAHNFPYPNMHSKHLDPSDKAVALA
jgi:hypothetical protein